MRKLLHVAMLMCLALSIDACKNDSDMSHVESKPNCLPSKIVITDNAIAVQNHSAETWTRIHLQVNDTDVSNGFTANIPILAPGQESAVMFSNLTREDGLRFDLKTYAVDHVAFSSDQGRYNQIGCDKEFTHRYIERLKGSAN